MSKDILSGLNPQQAEAVKTFYGPVLILAGAGTGKTKVITTRIAYMIQNGIEPTSILGVTFTNKAAREMRERLNKLIPAELAEKVTLGTFHSFCARVLRKCIRYAGNYNSNYTIIDTSDQKSIARQAAAELGYSKDEFTTDEIVAYIGRCKNKMLFPDGAYNDARGNHPGERSLADIYERYQKLLELQNTVDFDDMLLLTVKIFEKNPEVLEEYRKTYQYLLVDEYQDTNAAQFRLIELLAGETKNLCVVGDDDQSIYAWRGADVGNILDFPSYFPGTKEIKLEQNYRSTNNILDTANAIIASNSSRFDKRLWSHKGRGDIIHIVEMETGDEEAKFVVNTIMDLCHMDMNLSDIAILYRSNHLSRAIENAFREVNIRPRIIGGQAFFERKEVKDAAAYLKVLVNERDDQSLLRIIISPPRGMGDKAIESLRNLNHITGIPMAQLLNAPDYLKGLSAPAVKGAKSMTTAMANARKAFAEPGQVAMKVRNYLQEIGFLDGFQRTYRDIKEAEVRKENVQEFIGYIAQFEMSHPHCTLNDFLENYSLLDDNDKTDEDEDRDAPTLSTVHAAKGLEFPVVFVIGLESGLFPHERAIEEQNEPEERRLFYVAVTRAKQTLYLTHARTRFKFHENVRQAPSPYLASVPEDISERNYNASGAGKILSQDEQIDQMDEILKEFINNRPDDF